MAETRERDSTERLEAIEKEIAEAVDKWCSLGCCVYCYPLLMGESSIGNDLVDNVFDELRAKYKDCEGNLDVIVDSSGGAIDPAFNLAMLFRRFGHKQLRFVVPRWAKSAATLLVCAGDRILMSPIAELGPLDPQITEMNVLERRIESFSPLHIGATLKLIRDEYDSGSAELAKRLTDRLQFPLTLGKYRSAINIGRGYLERLLSTRMLKGEEEKVDMVAEKLTEGYADHGYCLGVEEANEIGLEAYELEGEELDVAWSIRRLARERTEISREKNRQSVQERLKDLPPEILDLLQGGKKENDED